MARGELSQFFGKKVILDRKGGSIPSREDFWIGAPLISTLTHLDGLA